MAFSIRRKRLACVECTRRKVKCDKNLPCRTCVAKDVRCSRLRGLLDPRPADTPSPSLTATRHINTSSPMDGSHDSLVTLVQELSAKVADLESNLQLQRSTLARGMPKESPSVVPAPSPREDEGNNEPSEEHLATLNDDTEVEDAATILEFLAWGRRKDPQYQDLIATHGGAGQYSPSDIHTENDMPLFASKLALCSYLQSLLPRRSHVYNLVKYHCECLLWYHGSFHAPMFLKSLDEFYDMRHGQVGLANTELQWNGLMFAIILGSLTCAPRQIASSWGFNNVEITKLSQKWFQAMNICLQYSDFMLSHSIFSVQAIATVTHSAHMLGHSNRQSVLLASAVRIAQSMGLHRLGHEVDEDVSSTLIDREIGRRVWCQLCTQDWFSISFTESYLINQTCFDVGKPRNCNDRDMRMQSDDTPTISSYSRYFYDVASLMPQVHDAVISSNTPYTQYEKVLEYDQQLRLLATVGLPHYLQDVPLEPDWPCYVPWARRCLAISMSHKVIMIHRKFLWMSFVNPVFSRTRKTCVAAARTIIKELRDSDDDRAPVLWIHHAFIVAAGIILCLDMIHSPELSQASNHHELLQSGLYMLSTCEINMIARRGIPLLQAMLKNVERIRQKALPVIEASHRENTPYKDDTRNLVMKEIIGEFYKQDRLKFSSTSSSQIQGSAILASLDGLSNWPPTTERLPLPIEQLSSNIDYTETFDDVFALATNYI